MPRFVSDHVHIRFIGNPVPAGLVSFVLSELQQLLFELESEELERLMAEGLERDRYFEVQTRLQGYRPALVQIHGARSGSIVLVAAVGGLTIWLLQQTLGESVKEAWLRTRLHERIRDLLLKDVSTRLRQLSDRIHDRLTRRRVDGWTLSVETSVRRRWFGGWRVDIRVIGHGPDLPRNPEHPIFRFWRQRL